MEVARWMTLAIIGSILLFLCWVDPMSWCATLRESVSISILCHLGVLPVLFVLRELLLDLYLLPA